jgi:ABC-type polar amino acid transport system ATPase subunit
LKREIKEETRILPWRERGQAFQREYASKLREKEAVVEGILGKMNLLAKKGSYPYSLSGGEAQRTAIVRALALQPKILCFDEPTSALDPRLKSEIAETILALKKGGTTMIVVTHEMAFALKVADAVIYMEDGKEIESGDASILLHPKTQELKDFLSGEAE